jgi:hypothetical protein
MLRNINVMKLFRHDDFKRSTSRTPIDLISESLAMRQNITEQQLDDMIEDSFPASDPPAWY